MKAVVISGAAVRRGQEIFGVLVIPAPILFLAWNRGGVLPSAHLLACAWVLAALGIWALLRASAKEPLGTPWPGVLLLLILVLQLAPLPMWLSPERAGELAKFASFGLDPRRAWSLYPYATIRTGFLLAGSIALFWLTCEIGRRDTVALFWLAGGLLALALAEAGPALHQYLTIQTRAPATAAQPSDFARGTFGNRNLLAAWLEGCYGVAIGLLGCRGLVSRRLLWLPLAAGTTAMVAAVAVLASFSRMGILALIVATMLFGFAQWRARCRGLAALVTLGTVVVLGAIAVGIPALAQRYNVHSLAVEKKGRLAMWSDSLRAAVRYSPLGAGAGAFPDAFRRSRPYLGRYTIDHAHNEYLELAVEWGAPGAVLIAASLWWWIIRRWRRLTTAPGAPACQLGLGCLAGAAAILLHAAVDFPLRIPAIAGLFAVLLGIASAASPAGESRSALRLARFGSLLVSLAAFSLAGLSLWSIPRRDGRPEGLERWSAEAWYRVGRSAVEPDVIETAYRRALDANPYAAPVWHELALLAETRGEEASALRLSNLALDLEPHTRRGQWTAANLRLRLGDNEGALDLFERLAADAPDLRRAVWAVCWNAGIAPELIERRLARGPDYLR